MTPRPLIFVSAVSRELRSARQLVANTLTFLGYQPVWQDIFGTEGGDLRGMLRQQIDGCKGVVQIVGQCYGAEPPAPDEDFGRVSYTQYEALYARKREKKVWYLFIDDSFPIDACDQEPDEIRQLQAAYRRTLQSDTHVYHSLTTTEGLEASVLKLRDDLTQLRRGVKQWAVGITALLLVIVGLVIWQLHGQNQMRADIAKLREGIMEYPRREAEARQGQAGENASAPKKGGENQAAIDDRVYSELGKQLGVDPKELREKLPKFAAELKQSPKANSFERANAAYVTKDWAEAERLALQSALDAEKESGGSAGVVASLKLAGLSAQKQIQYNRALDHLRRAETLTDRQRAPEEWAEIQHALANLRFDQGQYAEAEKILGSVVEVRTSKLGPENADTLRSRTSLANALNRQGKYSQAEALFREVITLAGKTLGAENPDTLSSRHGLANALVGEGKYSDAEKEFSQVLEIREKVLGRENPDTLRTRGNLAFCFLARGKFADAENEFRAVLKLREKVLGPEHPDTLGSRNKLAVTLLNAGKFADAEGELRSLIRVDEKILGPEHPDTLDNRNLLAVTLQNAGNYSDAESQFREIINLRGKVLGPEHPDTLGARDNLAGVLGAEGRYADAEAEFRQVLAMREKVLGPENPDTLGSRNNLGVMLQNGGKYSEAEAQFRELIAIETKVLGAENPDTLASRNNLADTLCRQGKYAEAEAEILPVVKLRQATSGPENPATLGTLDTLGAVLEGEGKYAEAEQQFRDLIKTEEKVLGAENPLTLASRSGLARTLMNQGKDADEEMRKVIALREKLMGPTHPDTLESCYDFARGLFKRNKIDEAKLFAQRAVDGARKILGANHPSTQKYEKLITDFQAKR